MLINPIFDSYFCAHGFLVATWWIVAIATALLFLRVGRSIWLTAPAILMWIIVPFLDWTPPYLYFRYLCENVAGLRVARAYPDFDRVIEAGGANHGCSPICANWLYEDNLNYVEGYSDGRHWGSVKSSLLSDPLPIGWYRFSPVDVSNPLCIQKLKHMPTDDKSEDWESGLRCIGIEKIVKPSAKLKDHIGDYGAKDEFLNGDWVPDFWFSVQQRKFTEVETSRLAATVTGVEFRGGYLQQSRWHIRWHWTYQPSCSGPSRQSEDSRTFVEKLRSGTVQP